MRVGVFADGSFNAVCTICTFLQTPLNTYNVAVSGTSGSLSHTASVTYTVVAPQGGPDYSISANPVNQTVVAGSSGKSLIILTSLNGFSGTVNLATSPPPLCVSFPC